MQGTIAEPHVGDQALAEVHRQHHVVPDARVTQHVAHHRTPEPVHPEADRAERRGEEPIHLVAPAATTLRHQAPLEARLLEGLLVAQLHVEILVGDRGEMGLVEGEERRFVDLR